MDRSVPLSAGRRINHVITSAPSKGVQKKPSPLRFELLKRREGTSAWVALEKGPLDGADRRPSPRPKTKTEKARNK